MSIIVPAAGTFGSSGTSGTTFSVSSNTSGQTGAVVIVVIMTSGTAGGSFTQTAGPTWTGLGAAGALQTDSNANAGGTFQSMIAWSPPWPGGGAGPTATFSYPNSGRWAYDTIWVYADWATVNLDAAASADISTTAGTTQSINAASASQAAEASIILTANQKNAVGTGSTTWTKPTGWTSFDTQAEAGTAATYGELTTVGYKVPVGSGSVAPGTYTLSQSCYSNAYQLLFSAPTLPSPGRVSSQAIKRAAFY